MGQEIQDCVVRRHRETYSSEQILESLEKLSTEKHDHWSLFLTLQTRIIFEAECIHNLCINSVSS